jgi:hypothetical protein
MRIGMKIMLLCTSVGIFVGFATYTNSAQPSGPGALVAKQRIKAQVLSAMDDGKMSQKERREILENAKDILSAQEYVGLVQTINRLSPDSNTPEDIGYAPIVDKQLMAKFPTMDLPWIDKLSKGNGVLKQGLLQQGLAKNAMPNREYVVREIITKQTIVKETVPQQSVAKTSTSKKSVVSKTTPKQTVTKIAAPKQSVAKVAAQKPGFAQVSSTKQPAAKKASPANTVSKVVILPPPPEQKIAKQPKPSTVSKVQISAPKTELPAPPLPPAVSPQSPSAAAERPLPLRTADNRIKRDPAVEQAKLQQPAEMWSKGERSAIRNVYTDYNVPVLNTPAAAMLYDGNTVIIKATFDQPLQPDETRPGIIRQ